MEVVGLHIAFYTFGIGYILCTLLPPKANKQQSSTESEKNNYPCILFHNSCPSPPSALPHNLIFSLPFLFLHVTLYAHVHVCTYIHLLLARFCIWRKTWGLCLSVIVWFHWILYILSPSTFPANFQTSFFFRASFYKYTLFSYLFICLGNEFDSNSFL